MKKQKSKSRVIRDECNAILDNIPHNLTRKSYCQIVRRYGELSGLLNIISLDEKTSRISGTLDYHLEAYPSKIHVDNVPFNIVYDKDKMFATLSYKYGEYDYEWYKWKLSYDFDEDAWLVGNCKFKRK